MSETLDVLIKVAERKVEAIQQELAKTRAEIMRLAEEQVRLEREAAIAFVQAVAEDDVLALQVAGAFQERMRRDVAKLKDEETAMRQREGEQRQELQALYATQKKYELLLEKQKLARRKERMKKTQNSLDEVAGRKR